MFDYFWGRIDVIASREALVYIFNTLKFLGLKPPKKRRCLYYVYATPINFVCVVLSPFMFHLNYLLLMKTMTMTQLMTALQGGLNVACVPAKIIVVTLSWPRLRRAEEFMAILDARCTRADELLLIKHTIMMGNRFVCVIACIFGLFVGSTVISAIAVGQPPYSLYIPIWDWHNSKLEFWLQCVTETLVLFYLVTHQLVNDSYGAVYIKILRMHIQILVARVQRLGSESGKSDAEHMEDLKACIVDHKNILGILNSIAPVISITIFLQFLITALILGVTLINIILFADNTTKVGSIFYFIAVLVQTFPVCYQASALMEDSDKLCPAIFHCNWVDRDLYFRKMLIFFMQRSQQTMTLSAMKLLPINVGTNINIAKMSFSFYTLIGKLELGTKS